MSRTVTALYDNRSEAESARQSLSSSVDVEKVRILDQSSVNSDSSEGDNRSWFSKLFMPDDEAQHFHEGMRRGGYMLCAEVDSDEDADRIISLLEDTSPVDLDERSQSWRSEGWQPQTSGSYSSERSGEFQSSDDSATTGERTVEEERIPIVEETLQVGKREVERGGARVRSYVRETPVNEQVNLREENVSIERRPVNETLSSDELNRGDLLQDREIEMRATGEEAVIGKEAHVNEEVVVRKTETDRTENVQDTVRHTEVDVDGEQDRGAFGFKDDQTDRSTTQSSTELENDGFNRR